MHQEAAKQETRHCRGDQAAPEGEPRVAQHEPGAEGDEGERPQAERLCQRVVPDDVA